MKHFECDFGNGVKASMDVPDDYDPKYQPKIQWTGEPTKRLTRPYVTWINQVNQTLANEWGKRLVQVIRTHKDWNKAEIWAYKPGGKPTMFRNEPPYRR